MKYNKEIYDADPYTNKCPELSRQRKLLLESMIKQSFREQRERVEFLEKEERKKQRNQTINEVILPTIVVSFVVVAFVLICIFL